MAPLTSGDTSGWPHPNPDPNHLSPQVEARFVRVVCLVCDPNLTLTPNLNPNPNPNPTPTPNQVNAATYCLLNRPGGPQGGPGPSFARSIGFFSCGFA